MGSFTLHFGLKYEIIYLVSMFLSTQTACAFKTREMPFKMDHVTIGGLPTSAFVTSIAPEDGRISPKHVELKEHK